MNMSKKVAIYARVSTDSQSSDNQLLELRAVAKQRGWEIAGEYIDEAISGAKGRDKRPSFDRLQKDAVRGGFDCVAAWSVDRLGRSLQDLVTFLDEIRSCGVDLYLHQQGLDTSTPAGKAMYQMCGVFAEYERAMIVERVKAGLAKARSKGRVGGRPRISKDTERRIIGLRVNNPGLGIMKIAKEVGVGVGTVQRILADIPKATIPLTHFNSVS
jgi:DNA invertase Pin-like site-specific DNA recombinase